MTIDSVHFWPDGMITAFRRLRRVGMKPGTDDTPDVPEILAGHRPHTRYIGWVWVGQKAHPHNVSRDQFIRYLKKRGYSVRDAD